MSNQKKVFYGVILAVLAVLAFFVFKKTDDYSDLKKTELVTAGTEEAVDVVKQAVKHMDAKDKSGLKRLMQVSDAGVFREITDLMFYAKLGDVQVLGCSRMPNSTVKDNLSVIVLSEKRNQKFRFCLLKNRKNQYRIYNITLTEVDPRKEQA